jgi:hypothetical protein
MGGRSVWEAFSLSGSSVPTLGFERPADLPTTILVFSEAVVGLILLALLITYLPSIYGVFSRRENLVAAMEVRAGSPPTGIEDPAARVESRQAGDARPSVRTGGRVVSRDPGDPHIVPSRGVLPFSFARALLGHGLRGGPRRCVSVAICG